MILTSIDYASGTGYFDTMTKAESFIDSVAKLIHPKDEIYIDTQGTRIGEKFQLNIGSVFKINGGIKTTSDERIKIALQLPGTFCKQFINQWEAIIFLSQYLKMTRIDIAMDDYRRRISQKAINKLGELGHYKGVNSYELRSSKGSHDSETVSTCYFGTSDKVVRFYNAEKVHEILADRWELQARGEYAEQITSLIRETKPENLAKIQASLVTHAIDFVRRGENWRDEKRYYFWEKLREGTEEIKLKGSDKEYSIEKSAKWIDKQVCATLTVFYEGFGRNNFLKYMEAVAIRGKERLNPRQQAIIAYLKRESEESYLNLPKQKKL